MRDKRKTDNTGILPLSAFSPIEMNSSKDAAVNAGHDDSRSPFVSISRQTSPIHVQVHFTYLSSQLIGNKW